METITLKKRMDLVRAILLDAAHGERAPLVGLIDYLRYDLHIPDNRIEEIAERRFNLPQNAVHSMLLKIS